VGKCGLNLSASREGPVAGACECNDERLGSVKGREFID
jgi:hypothetical protein